MSKYKSCTCEGVRNKRMRNWRVIRRRNNCSYIEPDVSPMYSTSKSKIICKCCRNIFRTKTRRYVHVLKDISEDEAETLGVELEGLI